jgi:catechol 2,3-dioxygenase-like lactoylglutathione lyase family enzyme
LTILRRGAAEIAMSTKRPRAQIPKATLTSMAVFVSDRMRAVEWYTEKYGLDILAKSDEQSGHRLVGRKWEGVGLHLRQMAEVDVSFPAEKGPTGILCRLPGNLERACAALKQSGVRFTRRPREASWGRCAMAAEPDGNESMLVPT